MGLIRTILTFLVVYFITKWILKKILNAPTSSTSFQKKADAVKLSPDKIIPCPTCGTYNPTREAFLVGGNFYCNAKCYEKRPK